MEHLQLSAVLDAVQRTKAVAADIEVGQLHRDIRDASQIFQLVERDVERGERGEGEEGCVLQCAQTVVRGVKFAQRQRKTPAEGAEAVVCDIQHRQVCQPFKSANRVEGIEGEIEVADAEEQLEVLCRGGEVGGVEGL